MLQNYAFSVINMVANVVLSDQKMPGGMSVVISLFFPLVIPYSLVECLSLRSLWLLFMEKIHCSALSILKTLAPNSVPILLALYA